MNDDEKFFAWLDGELGPAEAAEMEAKVAADPALKRLADQHRALGSQLRSAFDPVAEAPVPERLQAALRPSAQVIDLGAARRARRRWRSGFSSARGYPSKPPRRCRSRPAGSTPRPLSTKRSTASSRARR